MNNSEIANAALTILASLLTWSHKQALGNCVLYSGANALRFEGDAERGITATDARVSSLDSATARKLNKLGLARKVRKGEVVGQTYAGEDCIAMGAGWIATPLGREVYLHN